MIRTAASAMGLDLRRLDGVLATFRDMQRRGRFLGGQLALRRHGVLVVDEAIGDGWTAADGAGRASRRVGRETPFCVWSASKPLVAMTIASLEEQGQLDVNAPIASLLPEFGAGGKGAITTLDVLTHRSGVVVPELGGAWQEWPDWRVGLARVFAATPRYPRGTTVYHPYEFGWILAAIVERVSGRSFAEVFADRIGGPAGLAPVQFAVAPDQTRDVAYTYLLGSRPITVSGVRYDQGFKDAANGLMLRSFVPGGSAITTASALSGFYATLVAGGVAPNGRRIFTPATVAAYTTPAAAGWDPLNRLYFSFGRGFLVGGLGPSLFGPWRTHGCFGHGGALCSFGFGDARSGLSGAILTNGNWSVREFAVRIARLVRGLRASACQ